MRTHFFLRLVPLILIASVLAACVEYGGDDASTTAAPTTIETTTSVAAATTNTPETGGIAFTIWTVSSSSPVVVRGFSIPASSGSFFGRVAEVEFGDTWHMEPSDISLSPGPAAGTTLGPATLVFDDGSTLYIPEGTPGGNDCLQLITGPGWPGVTAFIDAPTAEQLRQPFKDCWLYGGLDTGGDVLWFGIADYYQGDSVVGLPEITAFHDGYATVAGVLEFPVIPDDRSFTARQSGMNVDVQAGKHVGCGRGTSFADWWPSDQKHSTYVDLATLEVASVECWGTF